ncbi:MAG: hypothetical protein HC894_16685 [Microcoleus sp. SM1_3_4]|nr:hypothetical protein [Microcoleus sp. SM1_3_4]
MGNWELVIGKEFGVVSNWFASGDARTINYQISKEGRRKKGENYQLSTINCQLSTGFCT